MLVYITKGGNGKGTSKGRSKDKSSPHKKNFAKKFSSKDAAAYIPLSEWKKLTEEQKAEARKAREAKGIPVRAVGSISQVPATGNISQGETGASTLADTRAIPGHLLRAPPVRHFSTTQRTQTYSRKRDASSQG